MKTFEEALSQDFEKKLDGSYSLKFGDGYELMFEKLIWDNQYYVALYKGMDLLAEKVVVKPGKESNDETPRVSRAS